MRYLDDDTDVVDFVLSANMSRQNLDTGQRAMVMARTTSSGGENNQYTEGSGIPLSSVNARAARGGVSPDTQKEADASVDRLVSAMRAMARSAPPPEWVRAA